jgi:hypothetical protein
MSVMRQGRFPKSTQTIVEIVAKKRHQRLNKKEMELKRLRGSEA